MNTPFDSCFALTSVPPRLMGVAPFHSSLLTKRSASGSMAGLAMRQATADNKTPDLNLTFAQLPDLPYGKNHSKKLERNKNRQLYTVSHTLDTDGPLRLFLYHDMSAVIGKKTENGWTILPEIFALNGSIHTPQNNGSTQMRTLFVFPNDTKTVLLKGEEDLIQAWPKALETTLAQWAEKFDTLPPARDPRHASDGLWPSFAAIPPLEPRTLRKATVLCHMLATYIAQHLGFHTLGLQIDGIRLDQPGSKKPSVYLYNNDPQGYTTQKSKELYQWQKNLNDIILHPEFPIQGRAWIVPAMVDNKQNNRPTPLITIASKSIAPSAHGLLDASDFLLTHFPNLFESLNG